MKGESYPIEYEGLKLICFNCAKYGHHKEVCLLEVEKNDRMAIEDILAQLEKNPIQLKKKIDNIGRVMETSPTKINVENKLANNNANYGDWMIAKRMGRKNPSKFMKPPIN